jgi:CBS domain-containing protein
MLPLEEIALVPPGAPLLDALAQMGRQGRTRALVLEDGLLAGLLSITDVDRVVTEALEAGGGRR